MAFKNFFSSSREDEVTTPTADLVNSSSLLFKPCPESSFRFYRGILLSVFRALPSTYLSNDTVAIKIFANLAKSQFKL